MTKFIKFALCVCDLIYTIGIFSWVLFGAATANSNNELSFDKGYLLLFIPLVIALAIQGMIFYDKIDKEV